jgi:aspartate kinase
MIEDISEVEEFSPAMVDAVSALGERLSSSIVTLAFRKCGMAAEHVDSRKVVVTDTRHTQAAPLYKQTYSRLKATVPPLAETAVVVMGGFIASTLTGETTTLGRGGSDFTASIVGAGIDAEEIQIWTDVDGMLTCDPRILPGGHRVRHISFAEAAELAYFGAKVLHPSTVLPAIENNIPVLILNSRRPEVEGTRITGETPPCSNPVKAIACKQSVTVVQIRSLRMLLAFGFLRRIFEVFDRYRTSVDMVATSEVSVSLTLDNAERLAEIRTELERIAEITVETNQAIICLVGDDLRGTPGVGARVFKALKEINVKMISLGASQLNLSFVVDGPDLEPAVAALHAELFDDLDPRVFA